MGSRRLSFNQFQYQCEMSEQDSFCHDILVEIDFSSILAEARELSDCYLTVGDLRFYDWDSGRRIPITEIPQCEIHAIKEKADSVFDREIGPEWIERRMWESEVYMDSLDQ